jgi:DNA-binding NtrC family response regulator
MPRLDGKALIKEIKNINKEQPIIVVSAYNESDRLVELIRVGISNFVMKPIEMNQFLSMLYLACKNIVNQKKIDAKY